MKIDKNFIDHLKKQQILLTMRLIESLDSDDITDVLMAANRIQSMILVSESLLETIGLGIMTGVHAANESKKDDHKNNSTIEHWASSRHYIFAGEQENDDKDGSNDIHSLVRNLKQLAERFN